MGVLKYLMDSARGFGFSLQACISQLSSLHFKLCEFHHLKNETFFK